MTYTPNWHGFAQQSNYVEVPPSGANGYPDQHESDDILTNRKFAQIVWDISPNIPSTPSNTPAESLTIVEIYQDGDDTYICEGPIGASMSDTKWRITRTSKNSTGGPTVRFAESGSNALAATDLSTVQGYTYS